MENTDREAGRLTLDTRKKVLLFAAIFLAAAFLLGCALCVFQLKTLDSGGKPRIVCIGDSLTFGSGVRETRDQDAWPAVLERELGGQYEVLNYGISGTVVQVGGDKPYDATMWEAAKKQHAEIYLFMWQAGASRRQMRVSQFFSVDTARSLVKMNEYYPHLLDSIIRREPNAYLAALYWDSEMFGRSTRSRKELEADTVEKDYRAELNRVFRNFDTYFQTKHKRKIASAYRNFYLSVASFISDKDLKSLYESLMAGDPKLRSLRALYQSVYTKYVAGAKEEEKARLSDG